MITKLDIQSLKQFFSLRLSVIIIVFAAKQVMAHQCRNDEPVPVPPYIHLPKFLASFVPSINVNPLPTPRKRTQPNPQGQKSSYSRSQKMGLESRPRLRSPLGCRNLRFLATIQNSRSLPQWVHGQASHSTIIPRTYPGLPAKCVYDAQSERAALSRRFTKTGKVGREQELRYPEPPPEDI
jgi:hypothetical protein